MPRPSSLIVHIPDHQSGWPIALPSCGLLLLHCRVPPSPPPPLCSTWSLDDCQYWLSDRHQVRPAPRPAHPLHAPAGSILPWFYAQLQPRFCSHRRFRPGPADMPACPSLGPSPCPQVGIPLELEAATKKYFPASNSGAEVRDKLVASCQRYGVRFQHGAALQDLAALPGGGWRVQLASGAAVEAQRVVLATGGLSYPKLGTTGDGFSVLRRHGHALHEPYAALTPLLGEHPGGQQLAGISLYDAELAAVPAAAPEGGSGGSKRKLGKKGARAQRTAVLFTHRGFSGPAILDLSHHAVQALDRGQTPPALRMQWTPAGAAEWEGRLQVLGAGRAGRGPAHYVLGHSMCQRRCTTEGCVGRRGRGLLEQVHSIGLTRAAPAMHPRCAGWRPRAGGGRSAARGRAAAACRGAVPGGGRAAGQVRACLHGVGGA